MKRFLIGAVIGLFIIVGGVWLFFYRGFYLDLNPDAPLCVPFHTQEQQIQVMDAEGVYQTIELRGVDMISSMPGQYASDFEPQEEDYLRWLTHIGEMGANMVRVYTLMDDDFYNALYQYNTAHREFIYLLQGIEVSDEANNSKYTAFDTSFMGNLIHDGKAAVDIIHGRKMTFSNDPDGGGKYLKDISPWVIGYVVGHEWNADTIAYTDNSDYRSSEYHGTYFSTDENASRFESMLAKVMDAVTEYESDKYKTQRLMGFNSAPDIDFLEYEEVYARQLNKYAYVDPEHIKAQESLLSGYFAAYRLFDFCDNFSNYLSEEQRGELAPFLENIDTDRSYGGYLDLLGAYHTMPVVAAGYGFSSSRGAVSIGALPLTEAEQGERLVSVWEDAMDAGWAGVSISAWQDAWERRSWNTAFATELSQNYLWHDLQTNGQNYGLMSFDPGTEPVCVIDGLTEEWKTDTPVLEHGNMSLYVRYDQRGMYLLIQGQGVGKDTPLYLPMDISGELGSTYCEEPELFFERACDFLLCLDGTANTRLLVQERYDALRENFNREIGKEDPFISWPKQDSSRFVSIGMALSNPNVIDHPELLSAEDFQKQKALGVWETGRLRHGNGDPNAETFDSLADFCFGEDCVEIRIPWLLINVADPTGMRIHQDYYEHYGVETKYVSNIWLGLGTGEDEILMTTVDTGAWKFKLVWRERLKQSYYVVQSHWKK